MRTWYPAVAEEELERIGAFVEAYCDSELARRIAALGGARPERPFAFEHDGVLLHGRLDVLHRDGPRALVLDYKTNLLGERTPEEIVEADYRVQRLVYALACFRAGAEEVEVVYAFLERPDAVVSTAFARPDVPALEAELSEAIGRINAGEFVPTPGEFTCLGCPALDVVCAGPRLRRRLRALARGSRRARASRDPEFAARASSALRSRVAAGGTTAGAKAPRHLWTQPGPWGDPSPKAAANGLEFWEPHPMWAVAVRQDRRLVRPLLEGAVARVGDGEGRGDGVARGLRRRRPASAASRFHVQLVLSRPRPISVRARAAPAARSSTRATS